MNNRAILISSVGTSKADALEKTTYCLEREVKEQFRDIPCYVGFSSHNILNKMKEKEIECSGIPEILDRMYSEGIKEIAVLPTNLLNGQENTGLTEQLELYKDKFAGICIGKPLLFSKEDYIQVLKVLVETANLEDDEALVLIGHGSEHAAGNTYQNLEYTAYVQGMRNIFVGTVFGGTASHGTTVKGTAGMDADLSDAQAKSQNMTLRKLSASGYKKVCMMPLLFVAGYHAAKDIMSDEVSWKSILEKEGYEVRALYQGIGELKGIREIFIKHLQEAMDNF